MNVIITTMFPWFVLKLMSYHRYIKKPISNSADDMCKVIRNSWHVEQLEQVINFSSITPWPHWTDRLSFWVREVFPMVSETSVSLYIVNVILSDIGNKWLGNPSTFSVWEQCKHFCIFLWNPYFLEDFSDSERKSVSSVWLGRKKIHWAHNIKFDVDGKLWNLYSQLSFTHFCYVDDNVYFVVTRRQEKSNTVRTYSTYS